MRLRILLAHDSMLHMQHMYVTTMTVIANSFVGMHQVWETSEFEARKAAIAEFNAANRFRKRGISILPTKFGISFTTKFLNQVSWQSGPAVG